MPTNPKTPASSRPQGATLAPNQTIPTLIHSRSPTPILDPGDPVAILNIRGINEDNKSDISALAMALETFGDFKRGTTWNIGKEGAAQLIAITRLLCEASLLYGNNRLATNNDLQKAVSDIKEAIDSNHTQCYVSFLSGGSEIGKGRRLQLMGCAPDVLLVLSICGSRRSEICRKRLGRKTESKSEVRKSEVGGQRVGGSGCRNVGGRLKTRGD
jgi:hypothetical protein